MLWVLSLFPSPLGEAPLNPTLHFVTLALGHILIFLFNYTLHDDNPPPPPSLTNLPTLVNACFELILLSCPLTRNDSMRVTSPVVLWELGNSSQADEPFIP